MKKKTLVRIIIISTAAAIAGTLLAYAMLSGGIRVSLNGEILEIRVDYLVKAKVPTTIIPDLNLYSINYSESFKRGERKNGLGNSKICSGTYSGGDIQLDYGIKTYTLRANVKVNSAIILLRKDGGGAVVFNLKSKEETYNFYKLLIE